MKKDIFKIIDEKGRVLIPFEMRKRAELEKGDIVKLSLSSGRITVAKVEIIEPGKQDADTVEAYVNAAVKTMPHEKQVALAAKILELAQDGGNTC